MPATCTINARTALDEPRIVDTANERGREVLAHNYVQTRMLNEFAGRPDAERDVIRRTLDVCELAVSGRPETGCRRRFARPTRRRTS